MKIKVCCDNNANIHSKRSKVIDTDIDLGYDDAGWSSISSAAKYKAVWEWVMESDWIEVWYEEVKE